MSYRILIEIGHEASIRTKRTPEGFTHDWEIFVRGCDADISHYVDRVVFNLHETFTKPRRVLKEPPYKVKESGYAGFNLLIDLHLKNGEEPKKISFYYDLSLQPSGPAIYKVQKEKYVFHHPNEEFRQRLIKGGAMLVNTPSTHSESSRDIPVLSEERSQLVDKPKLGGDISKKPKIRVEEPKFSNSFADLFGPPITKSTSKVSPDPKAQIKNSPKNSVLKNDKVPTEKTKSKHSPHKDKPEKTKDKEHSKRSKDEKRSKEKTKERERSKEKSSKRDRSPSQQQHSRPSASPRRTPKRESSPKKNSSPRRASSPSPKLKSDERKYDDREKLNDATKTDKKMKKDKRDKLKDKDKEKREKEHKSHKEEPNKIDLELKENNNKVYKEPSTKLVKENCSTTSKDKDLPKVKEKHKSDSRELDKEKSSSKPETNEKHKHKHKKKDREKSKRDDKERKHEKKVDKNSGEMTAKGPNDTSKSSSQIDVEKENNQVRSVNNTNVDSYTARDEKLSKEKPANPLNTLIAELSDNESSDSSTTTTNNVLQVDSSRNKNLKSTPSMTIERETIKYIPPEKEILPPPPVAAPLQPPSQIIEPTEKKSEEKPKKSKKHKDKHKLNKSPDKESSDKKRKRKSSSKAEETETNNKRADLEERPVKQIKVEDDKDTVQDELTAQSSADYMCILRDLQHKIMTLQDNSELQRVVQLIAETGQYEITRQTFDFDLCALDRGTVKRLQEFFTAT